MKKVTVPLVALAALGSLAATTAPASAWHRHGFYHHHHRPVVKFVAPAYPVAAHVVHAPRRVKVVYRGHHRVKRVVYR